MSNPIQLHATVSRRAFLRSATLASAGVSLAIAGRPRRASGQARVRFAGWAFEPQVVEANVKRFMEQNPDVKVEYMPLDLQLYNEKMVALFNAGTQPDAYYVRDINLGAWVEAGWVQPIDGLPGLVELNRDISAFNVEALKYKGKQYGTPYYGDIYVYMYDRKAAQRAGVDKPPVTLEQLKQAALAVKKAGLAEYPILKGFKTNVDGLSEFWSMVFASGGNLFDDELNPVYPDKDKTALEVLEWLVQAVHDWKILDPKGLELDETQARDAFINGQGFFTSNVANVLPRSNNPKLSKRAGDIAPTRFPGTGRRGQGADGLDAPLLHRREDEGAGRRLAAHLLHGWQGQAGRLLHRQGLVLEVRGRVRLHVAGQGPRHDQGPQGRWLGPRRAEPAVRDRPVADEHQGALVQRVGPVHPAAGAERTDQEGQRARRPDRVGEQGARATQAVELTGATASAGGPSASGAATAGGSRRQSTIEPP